MSVQNPEIIKQPVSVIEYCNLGFICYLVLVIWNLSLNGCALFRALWLLGCDMTPAAFSYKHSQFKITMVFFIDKQKPEF